MSRFGRRTPTSWEHVQKYGFAAVAPPTVEHVERLLHLPRWHRTWDQNGWSACCGFGTSMVLSIVNEAQARAAQTLPYSHRYNPFWLWEEAKQVDEFFETAKGDNNGTSVRATCDVLRRKGHVLTRYGIDQPPNPAEGIQNVNRWATRTDELRTAIANGIPCSIGVNWYDGFMTPAPYEGLNEFWIGREPLGGIAGGHCVCVFGASDRRQAFYLKQSWGPFWGYNGKAWISYDLMQRLLNEDGECAVITDK